MELTGIALPTNDASNDKWFDLNGRRSYQPAKGLYIKNGKKILKK